MAPDEPTSKGHPSNCWLDKMEGLLRWKILAPEIANPFNPPLPDKTLIEWLGNAESLRRAMKIRLLCEGYEVLIIKDLQDPIILPCHPSVDAMSREEIIGYMERRGIGGQVEEELLKAQEEIRSELSRRGVGAEQIEAALREPAKIHKRRRTDITTSAMIRIMRG